MVVLQGKADGDGLTGSFQSGTSSNQPGEFADFLGVYCDEEGKLQDERLLALLHQAVDRFPDPPPPTPGTELVSPMSQGKVLDGTSTLGTAAAATAAASPSAGGSLGAPPALPPLQPQKPHLHGSGSGRLRRAPPPPVPAEKPPPAPPAADRGRPLNGRSALNGIPQALQLCRDRIETHEAARQEDLKLKRPQLLGESPFLSPLLRLLRKAEQPLALSDLRDERRQHEAVCSLLDSVADCLEAAVPDVRLQAAITLHRMVAEIRLKGYDDLNPPPPLSQKRDTRFKVLTTSESMLGLCRAIAQPDATPGESLFCLRALRDASCYRAVARRLWSSGLFDSVCDLLNAALDGDTGIEDDCIPVAIELLWNIAELDPSCRAELGTEAHLSVLHRLLQRFLSQGHRLRDKELRNDLLVVLTMAADTPDRASHPAFLSSGLTEAVWLIGCGAELGLHEQQEYSSRMKPFVLTCSQEDFEMKRLLWNLLYLLCFSESNLEFLLEHDVMRVFLAYVDADCETPSVVRWPTLQLIDLQTLSLSLLCQLCLGGERHFTEADGARILLVFLRECLDVPLRNATLKILVNVAVTGNRASLASQNAVQIMLSLAEQAPEIDVKRDCLQILADTVNGDPEQQRVFAASGGIATVAPFLSLPLSSQNKQVEQLVFAAVDTVWKCVIGTPANEEAFLRQDGMHLLLDILQSAPEWIRIPLLSCINDLLAANPGATHEMLEWTSQVDGVSAAQLLIRLWREDDANLGLADGSGVIPEEGQGPPFQSFFGADIIQEELRPEGIPKERLAAHAARQSWVGGIQRSSMSVSCAATGRPSLGDTETGTLALPGDEEQPMHDIKAKIYCIFKRCRLSVHSPELANLTDEEKQRVEVIAEFAALMRDEVWREIGESLERDGIKPIGVDRARLEVMRQAASERWTRVRQRQLELQKAHQAWADSEERNFYRGIMRDCDHQSGRRRAPGRTGLSITEAKIRKAQMLKASFQQAVNPATAEKRNLAATAP
eukprot:TRINITY_DN18389_c0_g1_i1.p1 TRINITY_DN18389_c0_g1~~TRINITY_DN18389_c0_g1_i1.p1  ORF type:complete len:1030 (+),score=357.85 TRINITY_DN18389_c0_g1_i1:77-3091(+)